MSASGQPWWTKDQTPIPEVGDQLPQTWWVPIWKGTKSKDSYLCLGLLTPTGKCLIEQGADSSDFSKSC